MTIIAFVDKMKTAGWGSSGGWIPEELLDVNQPYDAEFSDKDGKLMFVKSNTFLELDIKDFSKWIKETEKKIYSSVIAQIF